MTNRSAPSAFVPSTVASVERGAAALVSRFAKPVRAIGMRAFGFADRIIKTHLGAVGEAARVSRSAHTIGSSFTLPIPWYELDARPVVERSASFKAPAPSRTVSPREAPPPATSSLATSRAILEQVVSSLPTAPRPDVAAVAPAIVAAPRVEAEGFTNPSQSARAHAETASSVTTPTAPPYSTSEALVSPPSIETSRGPAEALIIPSTFVASASSTGPIGHSRSEPLWVTTEPPVGHTLPLGPSDRANLASLLAPAMTTLAARAPTTNLPTTSAPDAGTIVPVSATATSSSPVVDALAVTPHAAAPTAGMSAAARMTSPAALVDSYEAPIAGAMGSGADLTRAASAFSLHAAPGDSGANLTRAASASSSHAAPSDGGAEGSLESDGLAGDLVRNLGSVLSPSSAGLPSALSRTLVVTVPRTALGRALGHTAWIDRQLLSRGVEPRSANSGSTLFGSTQVRNIPAASYPMVSPAFVGEGFEGARTFAATERIPLAASAQRITPTGPDPVATVMRSVAQAPQPVLITERPAGIQAASRREPTAHPSSAPTAPAMATAPHAAPNAVAAPTTVSAELVSRVTDSFAAPALNPISASSSLSLNELSASTAPSDASGAGSRYFAAASGDAVAARSVAMGSPASADVAVFSGSAASAVFSDGASRTLADSSGPSASSVLSGASRSLPSVGTAAQAAPSSQGRALAQRVGDAGIRAGLAPDEAVAAIGANATSGYVASLLGLGFSLSDALAAVSAPSSTSFGSSIAASSGGVLRFLAGLTGQATARDARMLPIENGPSFEFVRVDPAAPTTMRASASAATAPDARRNPPAVRDALEERVERRLTPPLSSPPRGVFGSEYVPVPDAAPIGRVRTPQTSPAATGRPTEFRASPLQSQASPLAVSLRPGGIGARAEQIAGAVGVRAAGMSIEFIDPARLPWLADARLSLERTLLAAPREGAFDARVGLGQRMPAVDSRQAVRAPESVQVAAPPVVPSPQQGGSRASGKDLHASDGSPASISATATRLRSPAQAPDAEDVALSMAAAANAPVTAGWSSPAEPSSVASQAETGAQSAASSPARRADHGGVGSFFGAPQSIRAAEALLGRQLRGVWSLASVFPAAGPGALTAAQWEQVYTAYAPSETGFAQRAGVPMEAMAGAALRAAERRVLARSAATGGDLGRRATPELVRPLVAPSVAAADRTALPDGRLPRGSFTWSRAASFATQTGDWTPPATVVAASAGGAAAAAGQSVWAGMPQVTTGAVLEAFGESDPLAGTTGAAPFAMTVLRGGASPAGNVGADARSTQAGREARGTNGRASAPASMTKLVASNGNRGGLFAERASESAAPFLRMLVAGGAAAAGGGSSGPGGLHGSSESARTWTPPATHEQPLVTAMPASEASAKMVEALRTHQQHAPSDDRITLADMTLVAVASATQQMAASGSGSSGAAPRSNGGSSGGGGGQQHHAEDGQHKSPEAEQREIEEMARALVEELKSQVAVAMERSGRSWEH